MATELGDWQTGHAMAWTGQVQLKQVLTGAYPLSHGMPTVISMQPSVAMVVAFNN